MEQPHIPTYISSRIKGRWVFRLTKVAECSEWARNVPKPPKRRSSKRLFLEHRSFRYIPITIGTLNDLPALQKYRSLSVLFRPKSEQNVPKRRHRSRVKVAEWHDEGVLYRSAGHQSADIKAPTPQFSLKF